MSTSTEGSNMLGAAEQEAATHAIERTSPKGSPFIGTCRLCGMPNLRMGDALKPCPNQRGLTSDQALIELIEGDKS